MLNISNFFFAGILVFSCFNLSSQSSEAVSTPLRIGETVTFYSNELGEDRSINVYLPHGYDKSAEDAYSVIYLLDGSIEEDFLHITGIVQFGTFTWINMIPPSIVVGIVNVDRKRDFTYPSSDARDQKDFPTSGGFSKFNNYLSHELIPYINSQYNVNDNSTLIGQSLGGLCATQILLEDPVMFTNYIIVSPSLWWDSEQILEREFPQLRNDQSIYIAVGKEGEVMERVAHELYKTLSPQSNCHFLFLEDKEHGDVLHIAAYQALETIFKTPEGE